MSELAFNLNGDPFEIPPGAAGWRVRKMKHKGAPEVVYGRNGQPLVLPLEADVDDLRAEVTTPGRYRLDPVDENNKPIDGANAGYVYVHELAPTAPITSNDHKDGVSPLAPASDSVVIEAMRMNAEIARAVVNRFPQMLEASAVLLRAADGAGLPARPPMASDEECDDGNESEAEPPKTSGMEAMLATFAQFAPLLMAAFSGGKLKMPAVMEMLDWRKAVPQKTRTPAAKPRAIEAAVSTQDANVPAAESEPAIDVNTITPEQMAHFLAIQSALSAGEAAVAREVAGGFSQAELRAWLDELSKLSVAEAVQKIRSLISGKQSKEGV